MNKVLKVFCLFVVLLGFQECLLSQVNSNLQSYEKGLTDKKSPFLSDNYISFVIQGNLNFETISQGINAPNNQYIDNSSGYTLRSNANKLLRITARLDQDMPAGVHLKLFMTPPRGANSTERILTSIDQNLLMNVTKGDYDESISYTFWYDADALPQQVSRRILFTVHDD
jgi:hypothetical protein